MQGESRKQIHGQYRAQKRHAGMHVCTHARTHTHTHQVQLLASVTHACILGSSPSGKQKPAITFVPNLSCKPKVPLMPHSGPCLRHFLDENKSIQRPSIYWHVQLWHQNTWIWFLWHWSVVSSPLASAKILRRCANWWGRINPSRDKQYVSNFPD